MEEKEKLVASIRSVLGRDPKGLNEFLNTITHPDVIISAKAFLQIRDTTDTCQKYQAPWNCTKETEAYTQIVQNGSWSGGLNDIIANWCVTCQAKLFGEDPGDIPESLLTKSWLEDPTEELPKGKLIDDLENPMVQRDIDGC